MRFASALTLILLLVGCQHGNQTNEAVRQGVLDHLKKSRLNVEQMAVTVSSVEFNGNKANAVVSMTAKGMGSSMPMTFKYQLEQQDKKWVVTGRDNSNAAHGDSAMPGGGGGATNPHGGAMPDATGGGNPHGGGMPSPSDLPPATKKQ